MKTKDTSPQAVQDCHDLLLWLVPLLDNFPRSRRFTLGERLESILLEVLELLVDAACRKDKRAVLARANLRLAVARHLWRLCHELKTVSTRRYAHGAQRIDALGAQIGGWRKSGPREND